MTRSFWLPVLCGGLILTIGLGTRQSFGIFLKPVSAELGVGRELWSLGIALSLLVMGVLSPFVGGIADRFGAAWTVAGGAVVYVLGMALVALAASGALLIAGLMLTGVGLAAAGFGPILGAVGRASPPAKRSLALGVATAGGSFGQFAIVPLASVAQDQFGDWHATMWMLAAVALVMLPLAIGLRERRAGAALTTRAPITLTAREASNEAFAVRGFWLLTLGFFVCGFHVTFVGTHLPAYISDAGIGLTLFGKGVSPPELGGWAIGLVGLFNIAGAVLWGWLGGRHKRKDMLTLLYLLRAGVFLVFLIVPLSAGSVLAFSAALGFLWLGTVPLTSGLVGYMFGPTNMSMLYGIVFFSHQLGSFVGGWGGGLLFDLAGNYDIMWWISIGLGLFAALCNWPIREEPVSRLAPNPAAAHS
ncbi:MAG: MFS transporter [Alphaproteobacteria bacterium]|nr:MFS transporter [Alphaproteobacteria bacterium]